ncbi:MAG: hypothetical protein H6839_00305 [Planctomycetes bacterium]|nr:hypothetical protein [Planctomycetota bacterium]
MEPPADPQRPAKSQTLWVLLAVAGICALLPVAMCTGVIEFSRSKEAQRQTLRRETAQRLLSACSTVRLGDTAGTHTAILSGEEARLLGAITQKMLAQEAESGSSWASHNKMVWVELVSTDGSATRLAYDTSLPSAYNIDPNDFWYFGDSPCAMFFTLVWAAHALEDGLDPDALFPSVSSVNAIYSRASSPEWPKWRGLTVQERAFVSGWFQRFNAASGQPPLDESRLFPAK